MARQPDHHTGGLARTSTYIGLAAGVIVIAAAIISPYIYIVTNQASHQEIVGHPGMVRKVEGLEGQIRDLDTDVTEVKTDVKWIRGAIEDQAHKANGDSE
jgi:hypothetical protein